MNATRQSDRMKTRHTGHHTPRNIETEGVLTAEYDALADLFLAEDLSRATSSLAHATEGGPAAKLQPRVETAAARVDSELQATACRANERAENRSTAAERETDRIEGVILGHLPVLASAWAGQYARALAAEVGGEVVLVRLQGGQTSIDLIGGSVTEYRDEIERGGLRSGGRGFEESMQIAAHKSRTWLIRSDEPDEPELVECPGVTHLTLLTGADDAAMVASYRTLKSLSRCSEASGREDEPELRLAIMGAELEKALEAKAKLERTVAAFLSRNVALVVGEQRMAPCPSVNLHKSSGTVSVSKVAAMIRACAERRLNGIEGSGSRIGPAARSTMPIVGAPSAESRSEGNRMNPTSETPWSAASSSRTNGAATPPRKFLSEKLMNVPEQPSTTLQSKVDAETDLASHIAGLRALPTRCPYTPGVQFAIDSEGSLHLLALAPSGLTGESAVSETVGKLVAVAGWAYNHGQLLQMASPGVRLGADPSRTTLHLLTDQPRDARRLLDSGVHVHLLSPARHGRETVWVCRDLN